MIQKTVWTVRVQENQGDICLSHEAHWRVSCKCAGIPQQREPSNWKLSSIHIIYFWMSMLCWLQWCMGQLSSHHPLFKCFTGGVRGREKHGNPAERSVLVYFIHWAGKQLFTRCAFCILTKSPRFNLRGKIFPFYFLFLPLLRIHL